MDVYDNPRGGTFDRLLPFLLVGGGYIIARNGLLGHDIQQQLMTLEARLKGGASGAINPGSSLPLVGARPAAASGRCPDFISGVQYVADLGGGQFETVISGRRVFVGAQAAAEAKYRESFGC